MYTLKSIDNQQSVGQKFVGTRNSFSFNGNVFFFGSLRSSTVESITKNSDDNLVVKTRNSKYTFTQRPE